MKTMYKRVNVTTLEIKYNEGKVIQSAGLVMRVTKAMADYWVSNSSARYTSKSKMDSYSKMDAQINRNIRYLEQRNIMIGQANKKGKTKLYNFTTTTADKDGKPYTKKVQGKEVGEIVWSPFSGKVYANVSYSNKYLSEVTKNSPLKGGIHTEEEIPELLIVGKQDRA